VRKLGVAAVMTTAALALSAPAHAITNGQRDEEGHRNVGAIIVEVPGLGKIPLCSGSLPLRRSA
jgi:hypothetical protein